MIFLRLQVFRLSVLLVAIMANFHIPAASQETRQDGFRVEGFHYPDAKLPMSAAERRVFTRLVETIDWIVDNNEQRKLHAPEAIDRTVLKSVRLNKGKNALLVNLDKWLMLREGPSGIEDLLHLLSTEARAATKVLLEYQIDRVVFVYDGEAFGYGRPPHGFKYKASSPALK